MFTTYLASYNQVFHLNFPLFFYTWKVYFWKTADFDMISFS
jgi:hypothetical protein